MIESPAPWDYYKARRLDGAVVSMPSGRVVEPPDWARWVLEQVREVVREEVERALEERRADP